MTQLLEDLLSQQEERLMACVHCGFCLPACPTYRRLGDEADSPRGRLHLMRAVSEGRLDPASDAFQLHIDRCLGCRACEPVCPSGVEYGLLLEAARATASEARRRSRLSRVILGLFASSGGLRLALLAGRLARATRFPGLLARLVPSGGLLGHLRLASGMLAATRPTRLPGSPAGETGRVEPSRAHEAPAPGSRGRVVLLDGCVQEGLLAQVNQATRRVLEANGYEVLSVPGQGCCGALHAHAGDLEVARDMARVNLRAFQAVGADWVVVNAAGCGLALREYGHLLRTAESEELAGAAEAFSRRVRDISQLLTAPGLPRVGAPLPLKVTYAPPCHLAHAQRVELPPRDLLASIPSLELIPLPNEGECCGGAGIYGVTHPELGGRIGQDKVDAVLSTGAEVVATGNPGCMMQIGGGLCSAGSRVQARHPVELLDESYRRAGFYSSVRPGG
ncbi:MAG: heterodisulfide reductase-related iron-sulfur binding cluster [Gemmatimonadota bacterium]